MQNEGESGASSGDHTQARFDNTPDIHDVLHRHARHVAEHAHPDHSSARAYVDTSTQQRDQAWRVWRDTQTGLELQLSSLGRLAHHPDPVRLLTDTEHAITTSQTAHDTAQQQVGALLGEPALRSLPRERITSEGEQWSADRDHAAEERRALSAQRDADTPHTPLHHRDAGYSAAPEHDRGISR